MSNNLSHKRKKKTQETWKHRDDSVLLPFWNLLQLLLCSTLTLSKSKIVFRFFHLRKKVFKIHAQVLDSQKDDLTQGVVNYFLKAGTKYKL